MNFVARLLTYLGHVLKRICLPIFIFIIFAGFSFKYTFKILHTRLTQATLWARRNLILILTWARRPRSVWSLFSPIGSKAQILFVCWIFMESAECWNIFKRDFSCLFTKYFDEYYSAYKVKANFWISIPIF